MRKVQHSTVATSELYRSQKLSLVLKKTKQDTSKVHETRNLAKKEVSWWCDHRQSSHCVLEYSLFYESEQL